MYEKRLRLRANPFTHFMHSLSLLPADASVLWKGVSGVRKRKIRSLADIRKERYDAFMEDLDRKVAEYNFHGPLGSKRKKLPLDVVDLHRQINEPQSKVRASWNRAHLRRWCDSMSNRKKPFRMSDRCANAHRFMKLRNLRRTQSI